MGVAEYAMWVLRWVTTREFVDAKVAGAYCDVRSLARWVAKRRKVEGCRWSGAVSGLGRGTWDGARSAWWHEGHERDSLVGAAIARNFGLSGWTICADRGG